MSIIGIREDEYANLLTQVGNAHTELLESVRTVMEKITEINETEGGFGMERVNEKVTLLLNEIKSINDNMESMFEAEETLIQSFRTVVDDYDTCC